MRLSGSLKILPFYLAGIPLTIAHTIARDGTHVFLTNMNFNVAVVFTSSSYLLKIVADLETSIRTVTDKVTKTKLSLWLEF